jgi:1,4-dihydroxy-2-naphthoate octaprenyltransferase
VRFRAGRVDGGQARAILWQHLASLGAARPATGADPTAIVPVEALAADLAALRTAHGTHAVRGAGRAYAALWARTFPTLVRHLRGRPEAALRLFCDEVYPYLRGDARAGRIERTTRGRFVVLLAGGLDPEYVAGLLEGFVAASGATGQAAHVGRERFTVAFRIPAADQPRRLAVLLGVLRVPLLLTAALGATVALAFAATVVRAAHPLDAVAVLVGAVGAQAGANALHELRAPRLRGIAAATAPRPWIWLQAGGGYTAAAAAAAWLVWHGHHAILAFAAAGLLLSLLYIPLRDAGLGPATAGFVHGPLIFAGAAIALAGTGTDAALLVGALLLPAMALGAFTAAIVFLDDVADRPLDEAGGKRTLAVRLPRRQHASGLAAVLAFGVAATAAAAWHSAGPVAVVVALPVAAAAFEVARSTTRNVDDPRRLSSARLGALGTHVTASVALATAGLLGASGTAGAGGLP